MQRIDHWVKILFLALCTSLPLSKAIVSICIVLLLILAIPGIINRTWSWWKSQYLILLPALLFMAYLPSVMYSEDLSNAMTFCYQQVPLIVIPVILVRFRDIVMENLRDMLRFFIYGCAISSVCTLVLFALPEDAVIFLTEHIPLLKEYKQMASRIKFGLYSPFLDRLHFSYLLAIAILFTLWLRIKNGREDWMVLTTVAIVPTIILLGARGAQLGLLLVLSLWILKGMRSYLKEQKQWKRPALNLATVAFLGVYFLLAPLLIYKTITPVQTRYAQLFWELELIRNGKYVEYDYAHFTSLSRLLSLKNHARLIKDAPVLGTGVGDFRKKLGEAYARDAEVGLNLRPYANNQYVFLWAAAGILALVVFLFVLYHLASHFLAIQDPWLQILAISWLVFMAFILMLDVFLIYQVGSSSFALFAGLLTLQTRSTS